MNTLICGSGRCGSSLVMQMLDAGGVSIVGTGPYYEPKQTVWHEFDADWLSEQEGIVKLLYPIPVVFKFNPGKYKTIWLSRDKDEQAKSLLKFAMNAHKVPEEDQDLVQIAKDLDEEERMCTQALMKIGPLMLLNFEHIINQPRKAAESILTYFQVKGDIKKMVAEVHKRGTQALPDMTLEDDLIAKATG